ncbi:cell division protein SepF [Enterococcus florum]|uniref:Cell division protein SepF n=1 Tax=Enterococcus florum TaxID=2480627 RepID=A0A4P5PEB7_9ENTE|nr:cell division protein SepF [Enterococcus florum]
MEETVPAVSKQPVTRRPKREKRTAPEPRYNQPKKREQVVRSTESAPQRPAAQKAVRKTEKIVSMPKSESVQQRMAPQMAESKSGRISVIEPRAYNEAVVIAKRVANGETVLINFQSLDEARARRVVDFLTGAVYMVDGDIKRVGNEMFLCTPTNIEIDNSTLQSMADQDIFGLEM